MGNECCILFGCSVNNSRINFATHTHTAQRIITLYLFDCNIVYQFHLIWPAHRTEREHSTVAAEKLLTRDTQKPKSKGCQVSRCVLVLSNLRLLHFN